MAYRLRVIGPASSRKQQPLWGWDQTKNWFLPVSGFDSNGNLKSDVAHTYTWDAENKLTAVDTVSVTFGALGRMVEQARGASYTQIVYSPGGGKLALMTGQTLQKAFVPLPGGGTAVYTSAGLAYCRECRDRREWHHFFSRCGNTTILP